MVKLKLDFKIIFMRNGLTYDFDESIQMQNTPKVGKYFFSSEFFLKHNTSDIFFATKLLGTCKVYVGLIFQQKKFFDSILQIEMFSTLLKMLRKIIFKTSQNRMCTHSRTLQVSKTPSRKAQETKCKMMLGPLTG